MKLRPNRAFRTTKPTLKVDGGLPPGRHRFQLVVVNADGEHSKPVEIVVTVTPEQAQPAPAPARRVRKRGTPKPGTSKPGTSKRSAPVSRTRRRTRGKPS